MDDPTPKHKLRRVLVFSLLAGLFGAIIVILLGLYFVVAGFFPASSLRDLLIPVGGAFIVFFCVTFDWLFQWWFAERMGGRVGRWQIMPVWLQYLMDYLKEDNGSNTSG